METEAVKETNEFVKYQHVERLGTDEVLDIKIGTCYIYPKIDGTNASIWRDGETLRAGSRNRELEIGNDNANFLGWCMLNLEVLNKLLCALPVGCRVFGEWLVPHSLKTYREDAWRRFYLFDVMLVDGSYMHYDDYSALCKEVGFEDYIPPIRIIKNPHAEDIMKCLEENRFLIPDDKGTGEGVVVKNYDFVNKYGRRTWAKLVTSAFKEKHSKEMGAPESKGKDFIEEEIIGDYLSSEVIEKVYAKIVNDTGAWRSEYIPRLLGTVFHDFVTECIWEVIKKKKNPRIDFKLLQRFTVLKIKEIKPEIF